MPPKSKFLQRAEWHDYHSKCIYMITLMKSEQIPVLSTITDYHQSNSYHRNLPSISNKPPKIQPLVTLSPVGHAIESQFESWIREFPMLKILTSCLMPDHLHLLLYVTERTERHLSDMIKVLKWNCNRSVKGLFPAELPCGVFEQGYNDRVMIRAGQKDICFNYIQDNPRRLLARRMFPEYFNMKRIVNIGDKRVALYGNLFLLNHPQKAQVRFSRKFTTVELKAREKIYDEIIRTNGVLVSPFIHPHEKAVKEKTMEKGGNFIQIEMNGFPDRYKPFGRDFELCACGRLLLVGPVEYKTRRKGLERSEALQGNALAEMIATLQRKII